MPAVLVLYSALSILGSHKGFDVNTRAFVLFSLHRKVDIDTQLTVLNVCLGDSEGVEQFLELSHDQFSIVRVSGLRLRQNLQQRHACSVVVDEHFVALDVSFGGFLLHLDALNQDMVLVLLVVVEEETAVEHDWVVLLRDLVGLRKVSVDIVLPVELDLGQDASTESQRSLDGLVQALFVQDGEHTW